MPLCSKCGKYEVSDMGLCRNCLAERSGKTTQTFEVFRDKYLTNPDEGIFWADDALLQYSYYTLDPNHFQPLIEGEDGAEFSREHEKLRNWYADQFTRLYSERLLAVSGDRSSPQDLEVLHELFEEFNRKFHNFLAYAIDNQKISGMDIINIILKQKFRDFFEGLYNKNPQGVPTPDMVDVAADLFDVGSGFYFLEIFSLLKKIEYIGYIVEHFSITSPAQLLAQSNQPRVLLYPWKHQNTALQNWIGKGHRGVIEMATATGKTLVGMLAIEELSKEANRTGKGKIVLITCHSTVILNQWRREIIRKMGAPGFPTDSYKHPLTFGKITISFETIQTLSRRYGHYYADLLIVDEVHHIAGPVFRQALQTNTPWKLGLTAHISEGRKRGIVENKLGKTVFRYPIKQALIDGIIPEFEWVAHPVYLDIAEEMEFRKLSKSIVSSFNTVRYDTKTISRILEKKQEYVLQNIGEFIKLAEIARLNNISDLPEDWMILRALLLKRRQIINTSVPRLEKALHLAKTLGNKHKVIMFLMGIESCEMMRKELAGEVDNVFVIHSQIEENPIEVVEQFKKSKSGILIGARMLDEGIDIPSADIGINVAFSKTELQLIQRMGRVLRKNGEKRPTFYQFVAIPSPDDYIEIMDAQRFVDDLAWVEATGLRMGLDLRIEWDSRELEQYRSDVETFCAAVWRDANTPAKIGTFNLDAAMREFSKTAIKRIPQILSLYQTETITDAQWDNIIRVAHTVVEEGSTEIGARHVNVNKAWYLLVLCGRRVADLQKLFRKAVSRIEASEQKGGEENHDIPLPKLCLDENGFLKAVAAARREEKSKPVPPKNGGKRKPATPVGKSEKRSASPVSSGPKQMQASRPRNVTELFQELLRKGRAEAGMTDSSSTVLITRRKSQTQEWKREPVENSSPKKKNKKKTASTESAKKSSNVTPSPSSGPVIFNVTKEMAANGYLIFPGKDLLSSKFFKNNGRGWIHVSFNNIEASLLLERKKKSFIAKGDVKFQLELQKFYKNTKGDYRIAVFPMNSDGIYVIKPKRELERETQN